MGMGYGLGTCRIGLMGGGSIMMILFLVLIGFLFYFVMKKRQSNHFSQPAAGDPLNILKSRLARGEITMEEFEQIKKTIS
jgi:putative membrane protein